MNANKPRTVSDSKWMTTLLASLGNRTVRFSGKSIALIG